MACSRNVDLRVCSDDVANLASRYSHFLLPVDVAVCENFDLVKMFLKFVGCQDAQIGETSNGCQDKVNFL